MTTLAEELEERKEPIARRAMAEMYKEDPFWEARFGEIGRKHSLQDGLYHLQYLRQAVLADDAGVLVNYAKWLRGVLVARGMCTAQLVDNLERIGRIVAEEKLPDAARAQELIGAAVASLAYEDAGLRSLQQASGELRTLACYLADAVAAGDPALFASYVQWARGAGRANDTQLAALERIAPEGVAQNAIRATRGGP